VTLHAVVALIAVFLQAASAALMFFIARAPGWERVRLMAAIALTAGLYNAVDVWFYSDLDDLAVRAALVRVNLFVAALHAAMWMRFTFADESGRIRSMPAWSRWTTAAMLLVAAGTTAGDLVLDYGRFTHVQVAWLGLDERTYAFNGTGDAVAFGILTVIIVSLVRHMQRTRLGEPGALGIVIGLTLYALFMIEEALVAGGQLAFMYLGSPGYLFAVLPLTVQLFKRFGDDARRLNQLSARLSSEVEARTVERDEARESLLEQQRLAALGRLAAGVGHEINNPLQYLQFQLEELRAALGDAATPAAQRAIRDALDGAQRIGRVVTSLRTYGVRQEGFRRVALRDVVEAALRIAAPHVRHEATLRSDIGPVPDVMGDEGQLVQLVVNPLVNAAQALAGSGAAVREVTVQTRTRPDGWAELVIADTGPGFDPSVLPRLGEPYVTTRARSGGTGLGLFVTRGLVDTHGGRLELANREGGGAEVRIRLPAAPPEVRAHENGESAPLPTNSKARLLVVDDEPALLDVLQRVLRRMGHEVAIAQDGEAALAMAEREPFDAIVSDLMMPNMSGAALAERLARTNPALRGRFIVMTGGAVTVEDAAFLARPDVVAVTKPVSVGALGAALARTLAVAAQPPVGGEAGDVGRGGASV